MYTPKRTLAIMLFVIVAFTTSACSSSNSATKSPEDKLRASLDNHSISGTITAVTDAAGVVTVSIHEDDYDLTTDNREAVYTDLHQAFSGVYGASVAFIQTVTVDVTADQTDAYGNVSPLPLYKATLPAAVAGKVKWDTVTIGGLSSLWIVDYMDPSMSLAQ
jgi:hypothetical protein